MIVKELFEKFQIDEKIVHEELLKVEIENTSIDYFNNYIMDKNTLIFHGNHIQENIKLNTTYKLTIYLKNINLDNLNEIANFKTNNDKAPSSQIMMKEMFNKVMRYVSRTGDSPALMREYNGLGRIMRFS